MNSRDQNSMRHQILFLAPHTCKTTSRSGIQRVAVQVAEALLPLADIWFVKWDRVDGQLRHFNVQDMDAFFQSRTWPRAARVSPFAERRRYRFGDTLPPETRKRTWLLIPEISYLMELGADIYLRIMAQAREYNVRSAAIFYDLIPITNPDYFQGGTRPHERYVRELIGVDLILPISKYASEELTFYQSENLGLGETERQKIRQKVIPVPLATVNNGVDAQKNATIADHKERKLILLLGTVEPRKRQIEVLRAFKRARIGARYGLKVVVVGSLHHKCAADFHALIDGDTDIIYHGYANDDLIESIFSQTRFCVFASNDEGFGLPICESLAHGVPCLTANFGSMREVAEGGGCLLVDVNNESELEVGLEQLSGEDALIETLRSEIERRKFRSWHDYASDVITILDAESTEAESVGETVYDNLRKLVNKSHSHKVDYITIDDQTWKVAVLTDHESLTAFVSENFEHSGDVESIYSALLISGSFDDFDDVQDNMLDSVFRANVWIFENRSVFERFVARAAATSFVEMLPTRCISCDGSSLLDVAADTIIAFSRDISRRRIIAAREAALQRSNCCGVEFRSKPILNIIISTYNRSHFVAENVRWLLSHLDQFNGRITLTVVDNASTDETWDLLSPYTSNPYLRLLRNPANVGMLGNLQVCSTLMDAQHSWVIGDDDYIVPNALGRVLALVQADPYLPFVFLNFGVYHRTVLGPDDRADNLIENPIRLTSNPSPTGAYPIKDIAAEHDNLFTAIYPIVFRGDLLSACFNYPFVGRPFSSLVESIPTTKMLLESYGCTTAMWVSEISIVGNAHNSWQRYRVPWHGVLMPLAFELAREAGVEPGKLYAWSQTHRQLLLEAQSLFPSERLVSTFGQSDLDASYRVFRANFDDD